MKTRYPEVSVSMVQILPHLWQIESSAGYVMEKGIIVHSVSEAEDYVKAYISSFTGWTSTVVPLLNNGGKEIRP